MPIPKNTTKNITTNTWNKQIKHPLPRFSPAKPMHAPIKIKISAPSKIPNRVYWLKISSEFTNDQMVTPVIRSPTTKIRKAPNLLKAFKHFIIYSKRFYIISSWFIIQVLIFFHFSPTKLLPTFLCGICSTFVLWFEGLICGVRIFLEVEDSPKLVLNRFFINLTDMIKFIYTVNIDGAWESYKS